MRTRSNLRKVRSIVRTYGEDELKIFKTVLECVKNGTSKFE